jgi:hypothetical protein
MHQTQSGSWMSQLMWLLLSRFMTSGIRSFCKQQTPWDEYTLGNLAVARVGITGMEISKKSNGAG